MSKSGGSESYKKTSLSALLLYTNFFHCIAVIYLSIYRPSLNLTREIKHGEQGTISQLIHMGV